MPTTNNKPASQPQKSPSMIKAIRKELQALITNDIDRYFDALEKRVFEIAAKAKRDDADSLPQKTTTARQELVIDPTAASKAAENPELNAFFESLREQSQS